MQAGCLQLGWVELPMAGAKRSDRGTGWHGVGVPASGEQPPLTSGVAADTKCRQELLVVTSRP